ncbi:protein kinase domain-containing protein [Streptomyces sp. NPDC002402]
MTGPLLPGDPVRLGNVTLLARLGAGGMGQVYLGRTAGGRLVAVKTVHQHLADDPHFRERFRREAAAARAVTGAHTAAVLDADPDSPVPWLATAFLPGVTLRRAVAAGGPLGEPVVRALGAALAEALTSIHAAGLVHRDLKPSNVLLTADGPRVIDFGIARAISDHGITAAGDIVGTPGFIAPEQITDESEVTAAADVFALGAVLAFAATGRTPFGDGTVAVLLYRAVHEEPTLGEVPSDVRELIATCLRKEPELRPSVSSVLGLLSDPAAPLWWREDPLRELIAEGGDVPGERTAVLPTAPMTAATVRVPPSPERAERRRTLTRRGLLLTGGGSAAGLLGVAIARGGGSTGGGSGERPSVTVKAGSAAPGALRWTLTAEDGDFDALLLAGRPGTVLVHASTGVGSGYVHACSPADAARRWESRSGGDAPGMWGVAGETLVAGEAGLPAVDLASGAVRGKAAELPPAPLWYAVAGGTLVSAYPHRTDEPGMRALDLRTGAGRWTLEGSEAPPPAVLGNALLIDPALSDGFRCVDAALGKERWTYRKLNSVEGAAAACALPSVGRFALLGEQGALHLVDARTGDRAALGTLGTPLTPGTTALGEAGGYGLAVTSGVVHGFSPRTGQLLWRQRTFDLAAGWPPRTGGLRGPVTADGVLLHWMTADTLQAVELATGKERWRRQLPGIAQVPPAVSGGTVYAATGESCAALTLAGGVPRRVWPDRAVLGLSADAAGWYARTAKTVRAYNRVV